MREPRSVVCSGSWTKQYPGYLARHEARQFLADNTFTIVNLAFILSSPRMARCIGTQGAIPQGKLISHLRPTTLILYLDTVGDRQSEFAEGARNAPAKAQGRHFLT